MARTTNATSSVRQNKFIAKLEERNSCFLAQDKVDSFESLKAKSNEIILPTGYIYDAQPTSIYFYYIKRSVDDSVSPKLLASAIVSHELSINVFLSSAKVPRHTYETFLSHNAVKSISGLDNILVQLKGLAEASASPFIYQQHEDIAIYALQQCSYNNAAAVAIVSCILVKL